MSTFEPVVWTTPSNSRRSGPPFQHAIRAWERRYGAVKPSRSSGRHRLYTDEDIERLDLLRSATKAGHSIRDIATLPTAKLKSLAIANGEPVKKAATTPGEARGRSFVEEGVQAVQSLNAPAFEGLLSRASVKLGQQGLIRHVLAPLVQAVGELSAGFQNIAGPRANILPARSSERS